MLTKVFVSIFLGAAVLTACGNDPNTPPSDGATTTPDACVGHACTAGDGPSVMDAEGGNIIFEHITFDTQLQAAFHLPAGEATATRVMAYFMSEQSPGCWT